jgi:mono/diheme cytochrome c family protein
VDEAGFVYVVTGSGFEGYRDQPHDWTQSLLKLADDPGTGLRLVGSYTPFNHCSSAKMDIDLGSGGAALLPGPAPLLVIGGKQGNAYLLNRASLPGRLDRRPPCSTDAAADGSLLPPGPQPQFGRRGPLNVFGPYSEEDGALDIARARSVPAAFRDRQGRLSVLMTGNTRAAPGVPEAVAPSLVRLEVVDEGRPTAHLRVAARNETVVFGNPGSPLLSSHAGGSDAVVWVLDENARRSALLSGPAAPAPVLHAFDAQSLQALWQSTPGQLATSGKYNQPLVVQGQVIVGTDRLQAFGLGAVPPVPTPTAAAPASASQDGATLYQQRCAVCHEQPQGNVPPRALLARLPRARIAEALSRGAMQAQAAGLSAAQIDAIARYLQPQDSRP